MLGFNHTNSLPSGEKAGRPSSTAVSASRSIVMLGDGGKYLAVVQRW